jgi:DNA-binding PadR family transcriptional regulator
MRGYGFHGHRGFGRMRGGPGAGEGRRGRVFDHGDLRWVVLALIAEQPRHGYEIIKEIEERVGGAYSPSPGVIYPTLTFLEETGLVSASDSEGGRKLYTILPEGEAQLAAHRGAVDALFQKMAWVRERSAGGVSAQVVRALENLRLAVRLKLEQGPLGEEQAQRLAEALDAAAVAVERA